MKFLSNFDTHLDDRLYRESVERFGEDRVLFVRRDKVYLALKVWLPLGAWIIFSIITLAVFYLSFGGSSSVMRFVGGLLWLLIAISGIYVTYRAIVKLIDYYMDYAIITPLTVMQYNQTGLLGRSTRSLDISKIRSISIDKKGLLKSIFNYGSVVFFSEGDAGGTELGDIRLNYISNPIFLRDSIEHIIVLHTTLKEDVIEEESKEYKENREKRTEEDGNDNVFKHPDEQQKS